MATELKLLESSEAVDVAILLERESQLCALQKDMADLKEIFEGMNHLVQTQEINVIKVEENIKIADIKVESAVKDIDAVYQKARRCTIL